MFVKLAAGVNPGTPVYLTLKEFKSQFYAMRGKTPYCTNPTTVHWAGVAAVGSHWQIGDTMYVRVEDATDDPFKYYTPPDPDNPKTTLHLTNPTKCGGSGGCGDDCSNC